MATRAAHGTTSEDAIAVPLGDRLRATGFLARQCFIFNRTTCLDEAIKHTGKGMLSLTFNCAKCHDHKYDLVS